VHRVVLSRINSGAAVYQPTPRGTDTFVSLADWPNDVGPRSGKLKRQVVEVAVKYSVPGMADLVVDVMDTQE